MVAASAVIGAAQATPVNTPTTSTPIAPAFSQAPNAVAISAYTVEDSSSLRQVQVKWPASSCPGVTGVAVTAR